MEKIKQFIKSENGKDILIIMIVVLVGIVSFELGRLSTKGDSNELKINPTSQKVSLIDSFNSNSINTSKYTEKANLDENSTKSEYFGSTKGHKYYTSNCSAGKSIKKENRIYFSTISEAESKGYTLSTSCN